MLCRKIEENYEESSLILRKAMIQYAHSDTWEGAVDLLDQKPELETLLTQRFQLYLRTCADNNVGKTDRVTKRLIRLVNEQEKGNKNEIDSDYNKRRKEALELIQIYPMNIIYLIKILKKGEARITYLRKIWWL